MKFKSNIEIQAGVEAGGNTGSNGQVLSSTGSGVAWINQSAVTSASDFVFFNVKNETGSTILKGKGVMAVGTNGNSGQILVDEMVADGTVEPKYFLGVLEESISNGGTARVISFGQLSQFNTNGQNGETWADGQILWCDPDSPGDFTITEPDGPNVKIAAAFIINSSTNGKIQVRVQANEGVHDMHDTKITSQVDGDLLVWDNTTGVWINDSTLNVDYTNNKVGIGTTTPATKLDVNGDLKIGTGAGNDTISTPDVILARFNTTTYDFTYGPITANPATYDFTFQGNDIHYGNITFGYAPFQNSTGMTDGPIQTDFIGNVSINYPAFFSIPEALSVLGNVYASGDFIAGGKMLVDSALLSNQENIDVDTGTETVAEISSTTYTAAFFDFVIKNGTNLRAGIVSACHDGSSNVEYNEVSTNDLGDTSDVTLSVDISGGNIRLRATTTSDNWSIKSLVRGL